MLQTAAPEMIAALEALEVTSTAAMEAAPMAHICTDGQMRGGA